MKQPEGFVVKGQEHLVCRLKRSLYIYSLKQSPSCWNIALDKGSVLPQSRPIPVSIMHQVESHSSLVSTSTTS